MNYVVSVAAVVACSNSYALSTDPLDFTAAPVGTNLSILYYQHNAADRYYAGGKNVANPDIKLDLAIARFVKYYDVSGFTVAPQILVPVANLNVKSADQSQAGFGDPILAAPIWLYNNPESRSYFAIAPYLIVPVGQYDRDGLSIGENRWSFILQPGFSVGLGKNWTFDFISEVQFFGRNNKFAAGDLKQEPRFSIQPHLTYHGAYGFNWSLGGYRYWGGETKVGSVFQNDKTNTTQIIAGVSKWISKQDNIQLQFRKDVDVENGPRFNGIQLRYIHAY